VSEPEPDSEPEAPLAAGAEARARATARRGDALVRRLVALDLAERGPPPAPFAWLALGSAGRREQALPGEQDHALVLGDAAGDGDRAWFRALAARVEEGLAAAGFPPCGAGLTAGRLARRRAEWCARVREAVDDPAPAGLLEVAILLDARRVAGELGLGPLRAALLAGAGRPRFLRALVEAALAFPVPAPRRPLAGRRGLRLDLKRQALGPLVLLARCYGLAAASLATGTCARLSAAREAGLLGADLAGAAAEAFRLLLGLRLRQALPGDAGAAAAGPTVLSAGEAAAILPALRTIRRLQERAARRFGLE
jgi:CBS domain-containing protein